MMLLRSRLSFLLGEEQTSQLQATMGTPVLVPVPRKVILSGGQIMLINLMQSNQCSTVCQNSCVLKKK